MPKHIHLYNLQADSIARSRGKDPHGYYIKSGPEFESHYQEELAKTAFYSTRSIFLKPNMVVMQEGLFKELDVEFLSPENLILAKEAKRVFPADFPEKFEELTVLQKRFLVKHGAAKTLLLVGEIEHVYPLSAGEDRDALFKQVNALADKQAEEDVYVVAIGHVIKVTDRMYGRKSSPFLGGIIEIGDSYSGGATAMLLPFKHHENESGLIFSRSDFAHKHTLRGEAMPGLSAKHEHADIASAGLIQAGIGLVGLAFCACLTRRGFGRKREITAISGAGSKP
ncbi:MAG: hypothetical protein Q7V63_05845 [Gammaproteobacteria bacterium]|nr:hypothetical protein [Gammaproteobacteria bacterium]